MPDVARVKLTWRRSLTPGISKQILRVITNFAAQDIELLASVEEYIFPANVSQGDIVSATVTADNGQQARSTLRTFDGVITRVPIPLNKYLEDWTRKFIAGRSPNYNVGGNATIFNEHYTSLFYATLNDSCWLAGLDFSPISVARTDGTTYACTVTLISPRHFITAYHVAYMFPVGSSVFFNTTDNIKVAGIVQSIERITSTVYGATDISIGTLVDPVPVPYAKIMPDLLSYMPNNAGFRPVISTNYERMVYVKELMGAATYVQLTESPDPQFASWYRTTIVGDSSSPVFIFIDGQMVILGTYHVVNGCPSITFFRTEIDAVLAKTGYALTPVNLSKFIVY